MRALQWLLAKFTKRRAEREAAEALRLAQLEWRADLARFHDAKRRGDTHAQHYAQRAARRAAQAALRLEIGR